MNQLPLLNSDFRELMFSSAQYCCRFVGHVMPSCMLQSYCCHTLYRVFARRLSFSPTIHHARMIAVHCFFQPEGRLVQTSRVRTVAPRDRAQFEIRLFNSYTLGARTSTYYLHFDGIYVLARPTMQCIPSGHLHSTFM